MSHVLELRGCTPEPLMAYMKALGIFRLVAEQKDEDARAWWHNDTFMLRSALDREALEEFFLEDYRPTPIVSPWNGGSGFYAKGSRAAREAVDAIHDDGGSMRLNEYRQTIGLCRRILTDTGIVNKPTEGEKLTILAKCRNLLPDLSLAWLDAVYVLTTGDRKFMPVLGTGANDGNMDFSINFIKNLKLALTGVEIGKKPTGRFDPDERRAGWVNISLFGQGQAPLARSAVGQFNPGGAGGPNLSAGFEGSALINPWDYVLMCEGALLFAGAAARRLSSQTSPRAVFPFTVDSSAAGYGTSSDSEYGSKSRAEFWAPLWDRPSSFGELTQLVSEGRAQIGRRQGSNGTDFARAVAGLGTERGVSQFQRYGFMVRNGLSYLAVPLGRFYIPDDHGVAERAKLAGVLFDLDGWLDRLRRNASGSRAPAGLGTVLRQVEGAIIEFCQRGGARDLQDVLIAVGRAERWVANSGLQENVGPLSLSREWNSHADDGSAEFKLARALASVLYEPAQGKPKVGPIRGNLEPVAPNPRTGRLEWKDDSTSFVWTAGDPLGNMLAVLERRCLDGRMEGLREEGSPPLNTAYSARLKDIVSFLDGGVDTHRVADLALPLSFVRNRHRLEGEDSQQGEPISAPFDLPTAYATMKLTLLPGKFECSEFGPDVDVVVEPSMLAMLRAGRVTGAYRVASRRLRASGLRPLSEDPGIRDGAEQGRLLAAALLFPLDKRAYRALGERALRKSDRPETEHMAE